jgi:hypothetical protein
MLEAFSDWLLEGAPKPTVMLYETDEKKLGTTVKEATRAIIHATMIQRCRFIMNEFNESKGDLDKFNQSPECYITSFSLRD